MDLNYLLKMSIQNFYGIKFWKKVKNLVLKPIGLGARDTLRLEAALHLYGNDLDEDTTPIEAGLSWSVPKDKISDYNGKEVIMNQIANGVSKNLSGLKCLIETLPVTVMMCIF